MVFVTQEWLLSALCAGIQPWTSTMEALAYLRAKITGMIGSGILTATLEKNGVCRSWYSAENDEDKTLSIDRFSSMAPDGGGFAIRGLQISAPGIVGGRSKRRGRGGMHQPPR